MGKPEMRVNFCAAIALRHGAYFCEEVRIVVSATRSSQSCSARALHLSPLGERSPSQRRVRGKSSSSIKFRTLIAFKNINLTEQANQACLRSSTSNEPKDEYGRTNNRQQDNSDQDPSIHECLQCKERDVMPYFNAVRGISYSSHQRLPRLRFDSL